MVCQERIHSWLHSLFSDCRFAFRMLRKSPSWPPGDVVYDDAVFLPEEMPEGEYDLALALVDPVNRDPKVKLAIAGSDADGWYPLGRIRVGQEAEAHDRK